MDVIEDLGYSIESLDRLRRLFENSRRRLVGMWKALDSYDSGEFWDTIIKKLPKHQLIPDTNYIYYVKQNQIDSVYAAPYVADVLPMDPADQELSRQINKFIEYIYNQNEMGYKQLQAANRTALWNVGFVQGAWDEQGTYKNIESSVKGTFELIVRDPMSVLLDPNFEDFQKGRAVFIVTEDSIENIEATYPKVDLEKLKASIDKREKNINLGITNTVSDEDVGKSLNTRFVRRVKEGMLPVWIAYKKVPLESGGFRIDQIIYTIDNIILDKIKGIKPNYYPIVPLYGSPPTKGPYPVGICQRIIKNVLSLNVLNSVAVTHTYASQRTPWVFDLNSGLSLQQVARDINNPDKVFGISSGDPTKALFRLEYPALPKDLQYIKESLKQDIKEISGIDDKYTGQDTASVTTTGGMDKLQQRATLPDNTRISMIEQFAKGLTKMIIDFHLVYGGKYSFIDTSENSGIENPLEVDFSKVTTNDKKFLYSINASPLLPKTRQRLAEAANMIMQMQMQFAQGGQQVQLITAEEWLFFQDFPQKDMILDRMKLDRLRNDKEEIAAELTSFAAMTEQGVRPEQAVDQLSQERAERRKPNVMKNILQNMKK